MLGAHIKQYDNLRWERWSGESITNKLFLVLRILSELRSVFTSLVQLCDRVRSAKSLVEKCFWIVSSCWKFRNIFGYTAAGAWIYRGAVSVFSGDNEEDIFIDNIPRAPSEAPRPLLFQ